MKLLTELPKDAEQGSYWIIYRESGESMLVNLRDGGIYEGTGSTHVDLRYGKDGSYDKIAFYGAVTDVKTERLITAHDMSVTLDPEALSTILRRLDIIFECMKHLPEHILVEHRRRDASSVMMQINKIKDDILE